jgi:hypothetical protein
MLTISKLVPGVIKKLRNRDDVAPDIPEYCKSAILDLTENYEFEELRAQGPLTSFTTNVNSYPKSGPNCPFIWPTHLKLTFIVSWFCYFQPLPITLGQTTGLEIKQRTVRVVEPMSTILGQPTTSVIIGDQILVGFMPNQNYATQMRYQRQHPFTPSDDPNLLASSLVYMPDDWKEIVEYAAAEKACYNIGMSELGQLYHNIIYGNPQKRQPGIIAERQSQQDRNTAFNERQLRPTVRRYT